MNKSQKTKKKMSRNKKMLIILCIFMSLVLIFGITLGIMLGVKNARARFSYGGVRIEEGESAFLSAAFKYSFVSKNASKGAEDTPEFWNSLYKEGVTYGDFLRSETEKYIKEVVVKNYLFDSFCELTLTDEVAINRTVKEVLEFRAEGSVEKFDEIYAAFGFDYEDFENAAELLYKEQVVGDVIYGVDGAKMKSFTEECDRYFEKYSHVKLLFIRTEDKFLLDANGNRVTDEHGKDTLIPLTDTEKAEINSLLSEIREAIDAYENKSSGLRMTPEYFDLLLLEHGSDDPVKESSGYYFSDESSYTANFITNDDHSVDSQRVEIVKRSLSMKKGSYAELPYSGGVCFIYKYENTDGAYTDTSADGFFSDFYSLAAENAFADAIGELLPEVKVSDKFSDIDLVSMPTQNMFIPRF